MVIKDTTKEQRILDAVKEQRQLIVKLEGFDLKYKKNPRFMRTKTFIRTRLNELHVLWHEFESNHQLITHQYKILNKGEYLGQSQYVKLERLYYHLIDQFKERLAEAHENGKVAASTTANKSNAAAAAAKPTPAAIIKSSVVRSRRMSIALKKNAIKREIIEWKPKLEGSVFAPVAATKTNSAKAKISTTTTSPKKPAAGNHNVKFIAASSAISSKQQMPEKLPPLTANSNCDQILKHLSIVMRNADDDTEDIDDENMVDVEIEEGDDVLDDFVGDDDNESVEYKPAPKTELPYFNGDFQTWQSFSNIYTAAVHNNEGISGAQKLTFLKSRMVGDAAGLLEHIPVAEENYRAAWKLLVDRYANIRLLVNEQLRILMSQSNAVETAESLRSLLQTTSGCVKALRSLQVPTKDWSPILVYIVAQRLPSESRQLWEQSCSKNELPEFQEMQAFLDNRSFTLDQGVYWVSQIQDG